MFAIDVIRVKVILISTWKFMKIQTDLNVMFAWKLFTKIQAPLSIIEHIEGKNPFPCQITNKRIALNHHLVQHQAIHSEIKPFKCSIYSDGRIFKTKHQLSDHMIFHYELKFSCSHFDYKTHTKCNLNIHEKLISANK